MKNTFIMLLVAVLFCLPALGQEDVQIRKVAILETIDREGNISAGVKLLVRSNLARAISSTPGYEGYDRVDVASIMGEQDFQRTGMVNNDQIKKLGEMTGASDILVTEVAMIDASNIIITAKILDVESARLLQTAYVQTSTTPIKLESGCNEVAAQLLGIESNNLSTYVPTKQDEPKEESAPAIQSNYVQPDQTITESPTTTTKKKFKPQYSGNVDLGYSLDVGGDGLSAVTASTSHGCLIIPYLYVGAGASFRYYHSYSDFGLPIFVNVRGIYPLNTIKPFLDVKGGYEIINGGSYSSIALGVGIRKFEVSLGVDMTQAYRYSYVSDRYGSVINESYKSFMVACFAVKFGFNF